MPNQSFPQDFPPDCPPDFPQGFPDEDYPPEEYFDDMDDGGYDDYGDNWQNNGPRGNMRGGGWGGFDGPWGPPPNVGNLGPSGFAWGRGFGPNGPPIRSSAPRNTVIRYLMNCGVPKEQLKKLPNDFLRLISPEFCGVCNVFLESYFFSRSHYVSHRHAKNQKKWLNPAGIGFQRKNEVPLKSRDLYCELCDVHITSKSHAESHYSGRPHRAIVDGRKNPKNAKLLRKNQAARLDQLIRREKRHLKNVKEVEKEEEITVQEKPISADLYCEICKAPVTCSEQMTIHLNGKRHLAKEKRHILNMMKGNTEGDKKADDAVKEELNNEDEDGDEAEDEEGDEAAEGNGGGDDQANEEEKQGGEGGDEYDWGNGSGTWEDDAQ